jgi:hypothetical protein
MPARRAAPSALRQYEMRGSPKSDNNRTRRGQPVRFIGVLIAYRQLIS